MSAALQTPNLSAEAIALIKEGSPKSKVETPVIAVPSKGEPENMIDLALAREKRAQGPEAPSTAKGPEGQEMVKAAKPKAVREKDPEPVPGQSYVTMTFRLPTEIPQGLLRASTDRKIKKIRPFTQQEIASEALSQWLKKQGFLE
jgi:hypothetical protein